MAISWAGLAVLMGTVLVPSLGAAAATCQSGGDYDIDCTWPDSTACDGANSTPRSKTLPTGGILELRYDSGCRSIWGRTPSSLNEEVFVVRDSCSAGNTARSEEHTSELQSRPHLVCRLLLE